MSMELSTLALELIARSGTCRRHGESRSHIGRFEAAIPPLVHCETMPRAVWPTRRTEQDSQEARVSRRILKGGGMEALPSRTLFR